MNNISPSPFITIDRDVIYRWLSGLYISELSEEMLDGYSTPEGFAFLEAMAKEKDLEAVSRLLLEKAENQKDRQSISLDLAGEYARLFLGVAGRQSAPPYASAYLSENGLLYQKATMEMKEVLSELNMSIDVDTKEPADHIAIQLNVMAELINRENQSVNENNSASVQEWRVQQAAFIKHHLLSWLPAFSNDCARQGDESFYNLLGKSLLAFVQSDLEMLSAR